MLIASILAIFTNVKILIIAATQGEIDPVKEAVSKSGVSKYIEFLVTGPGMIATAFSMGQEIKDGTFDLLINIGLCGSFKREIAIGSTVNIFEDRILDFGAEDHDSFLPFENLGIPGYDEKTFSSVMNSTFEKVLTELPSVKGITVNLVHGNEESIRRVIGKHSVDVESMEGAAFFYSAKRLNIKSLQIRAVSNFVEPRKREAWNIPLAMENLSVSIIKILRAII